MYLLYCVHDCDTGMALLQQWVITDQAVTVSRGYKAPWQRRHGANGHDAQWA